MFDSLTEALPALGMVAMIAAAAAVGGGIRIGGKNKWMTVIQNAKKFAN